MPASEFAPIHAIADSPGSLYSAYDVGNTACVPGPSNGAVIGELNDLAASGKVLTPLDIRWFANGPNGKPYLKMTNDVGGRYIHTYDYFDGEPKRYFMVARVTADCGQLTAANGGRFWLRNATQADQQYESYIGWCRKGAGTRQDGWHVHTSGWGQVPVPPQVDGTVLSHQWLDGQFASNTTYGALPPNANTYYGIGNAGANLEIAKWYWTQGDLSVVDTIRHHAGLAVEFDTYFPDAGVLLSLGNSTTSLNQGLSSALSLRVGDLDLYTVNLGRASGGSSTLVAQQAEILEICQFFLDRGKKAIITLHHGQNDPAVFAIPHLQIPFYQQLRAMGARIILISETASDSAREADRLTLNEWERPNWPTYFDAFVDAGADEFLGVSPRPSEAEPYFADDVGHLTWPLGHGRVAELAEPAIRELAAEAPPEPALEVTPPTATAGDGVNSVSITANLSNSDAALSATATAGTLSTASPLSGQTFTWTKPTGSGSATVTVTDAFDGLADTCTIFFTANSSGGGSEVTIEELRAELRAELDARGLTASWASKVISGARWLVNKKAKVKLSGTASRFDLFGDNGNSVISTQAVADDGAGNTTIGAAT